MKPRSRSCPPSVTKVWLPRQAARRGAWTCSVRAQGAGPCLIEPGTTIESREVALFAAVPTPPPAGSLPWMPTGQLVPARRAPCPIAPHGLLVAAEISLLESLQHAPRQPCFQSRICMRNHPSPLSPPFHKACMGEFPHKSCGRKRKRKPPNPCANKSHGIGLVAAAARSAHQHSSHWRAEP